MAGIAFRLQKMLSGDSYGDVIRAYLYSAIIAAGPFLVVIATLSAIKIAVQTRLTIEEGEMFLGLIVYVFGFSMIAVSPFIYVVTRYLADKYYLKEYGAFSPSYVSVLQTVFILQSISAILYLRLLPLDFNAKWTLFSLYLCTSGMWIAMIYLSAARSYLWIVFAFVASGVGGIVASLVLGSKLGFNGFLYGFTIGQGLCFLLLTMQIFREFGFASSYDFGFFAYFKQHPSLVAIGIFYYAGIWVDKLIYWFSDVGQTVAPYLRVYVNYDSPMFLAYLTVVPSMAFFLVQMETSFVKVYHAYYQAVRGRATLHVIRECRQAMITNLSHHFQKYAIFQGSFSGILILFFYNISDTLGLNPYQIGIMRIGILGAFLQMGFLMILNIIFYFDFQKDALWMTLCYFVANAVFTYATLKIGYHSFGFGYTIAGFITVLVSFLMLNNKLKNLDYWTFMRQPIVIPRFKLEGEMKK